MPLRKAALAAALISLIWTVLNLLIVRRCGLPQPAIHDEFSYLLAADTFVHGRLSNSPHPLAQFFESPHILVRPTYASKYPPGQALVLALGERLFGAPYYGVLIGGAVMIFLFALTLAAWTAPVPAMGVSVLLALLFLPPMYWVYSYWGGCVAAAGGAALLLSFMVYRRDHTFAAGVLFASGAVTLFLTRPYEGGVFTAVVVIVCAARLYRERGRLALAGMRAFLLSAVPIAIAGMLWTGIYDRAVTGNPIRLPYMLHAAQYNIAPVLWILPLSPKHEYGNPRLAAQYEWDVGIYKSNRGGRFVVIRPFISGFRSAFDTFGSGLLLLLLVPFAWRDWRVRLLAVVIGISVLGLGLEVFHFAHYAAPVTMAIALLVACGAEAAWQFRMHSRPYGAILTCVVLAISCAFPLRAVLRTAREGTDHHNVGDQRAKVIADLSTLKRGQLVIVHYPDPLWNGKDEWVYNNADIDLQKVIFAHDLGMDKDAALLHYYRDRQIWLLTFEHGQYCLSPYPPGAVSGRTDR